MSAALSGLSNVFALLGVCVVYGEPVVVYTGEPAVRLLLHSTSFRHKNGRLVVELLLLLQKLVLLL